MKHSESLALREIVRAELVRSNPKELTGKYISGQTFAISDLAYRSAIIGRHFEDCHIHGPAVLAVVGIGHLADCRIDGTPESLFITMNHLYKVLFVPKIAYSETAHSMALVSLAHKHKKRNS